MYGHDKDQIIHRSFITRPFNFHWGVDVKAHNDALTGMQNFSSRNQALKNILQYPIIISHCSKIALLAERTQPTSAIQDYFTILVSFIQACVHLPLRTTDNMSPLFYFANLKGGDGSDNEDDTSVMTQNTTHSLSSTHSTRSTSTSSTASSSSGSSSSTRRRRRRQWKATRDQWRLKVQQSMTTYVTRQKVATRRRRRRRNLSVSFAKEPPEEIPTLSRNDYTKAERKACWMKESQIDKTLEKCKRLVQTSKSYMGHNGKNDKKKVCLRGLEKLSEMGLVVSQCNKQDAYQAVLYSKFTGQDLKEYDADKNKYEEFEIIEHLIAKRYTAISERCIKRAIKQAQQDEIDAVKYLTPNKSKLSSRKG